MEPALWQRLTTSHQPCDAAGDNEAQKAKSFSLIYF
jgi:hypothetical protein